MSVRYKEYSRGVQGVSPETEREAELLLQKYYAVEQQKYYVARQQPTQPQRPVVSVPTHMNDPISKQIFKGVAETQKMQADPLGYAVEKTVEIGAGITGLAAPTIAIKGALIGVGVAQGIVGVTQQRPLSPSEVKEAAFGGAAFSGVSSVVFGVSGVGALEGVKGVAARAGVSAGLVGGANYVVSGGKPEAAMYGAAFGAGFSLAGEAASYAYPRYVKPALSKAYEKMFPERTAEQAMLNHVTGAEGKPDVSFKERMFGKKTPDPENYFEKSLYKHVTSPPRSVIQAKDVIGVSDVSSNAYQGPSGWVKQTLYVKQAVQRTSFLSTLQLAKQTPVAAYALTRTVTPKTTQKQGQKQEAKTIQQQVMSMTMQRTVTQQALNPFVMYGGKPYYRQRSREQEEYAFIVYPETSPLTAPSPISMPSIIQRTSPLTKSILGQTPKTIQNPFQTQTQIEQQTQAQIQKQVQQQIQELTQTQKQRTEQKRNWNYSAFEMPPGFTRISKEVFGGSQWYLRKNPLKSTKQMLKEILKT